MLYEIDGKYYVLASRRYIQVTISKDANGGYDVTPVKNAEPIEYSKNIKVKTTTVEEAFNSKSKKFKDE